MTIKTYLFAVLGCALLACQESKPKMTQETFEAQIRAAEASNLANKTLANGWYQTASAENDFKRLDPISSDTIYMDPRPVVLPAHFARGKESENYQGIKGITFYFNEPGTEAWAKATHENIGSRLIFILDDEILSAPLVHSQITTGASVLWQNEMTEEEWNRMTSLVKANE